MRQAEAIKNAATEEDRWERAPVSFGRAITVAEFLAEFQRMREGTSWNVVWQNPYNGAMGWIENRPGYRGQPALEMHYRHLLDRPAHVQTFIPKELTEEWLEQFAWGFHPDHYAKEAEPGRGFVAWLRRMGLLPYGSRAELEREAQEARDRNRPAWQKKGTDRVYW
jgi:hypothetical protein